MEDMDVKQKVLKEIMSLMDDKEGEGLKSHPKFMAAKLEVEKPEEMPTEDKMGKMSMGEKMDCEQSEELDSDSLEKLLAMYKKLK